MTDSPSQVSIFGIRHHGPGSARSLCQALELLGPDALLIEGPPDAEGLLSWAAHVDLQPPVALLIYVRDEPGRAVYYPFAVFSPEWQALQYGLRKGIPVRFMDLPQAFSLAPAEEEAQASADEAIPPSSPSSLAAADPEARETDLSPLDPLTWIAWSAGYSDSERWWEHMVEHRGDSRELFTAIGELMGALRTEVEKNPPEGFDTSALSSPREMQREAYMRQTIRNAQKEGFTNIAAVCGAWHAPALKEMPPAAHDARLLKGLKKVKVEAAWVPWSYGRLSWMSGYGAGIESPGWYEHLWQAREARLSTTRISINWLARVAHLLREEDLDASSAHVIEAVRLAEALAALRGRPLPGLPELSEAVETVFCFGNDLSMQLIAEKLVVNEKLGRVPDEAPVTPLQADLARQQKRLRLPPEAILRDIDLDLRKPNDLERSALLHRLGLLGIEWGVARAAAGKKGTFHELWQLRWQPEFAVGVVEASLWGNSVADAATALACHQADQAAELPALTGLISEVMLADLPRAVSHLIARLDSEATAASDVGQLMDALPALAQVLRYGNVRQTDTEMIARVHAGLFARICVGLLPACGSLNDEAAEEMLGHLTGVHQTVVLLQIPEDTEAWQATLQNLVNQSGLHGLIAGRVCRILLDRAVFDSAEAARRMGLALSTATDPNQAASWVEGFLRDSGALLLHDDALWRVLDSWVASLSADAFTQLLPLIRRTFSTFAPAERRAMGERARRGTTAGASPQAPAADFDVERANAVLPLLRQLLGLAQEQPGPGDPRSEDQAR